METTTFESSLAIQKYLSALEARLKGTPDRAADERSIEGEPVNEGLADAREFLQSEWEALRATGADPADDFALYEHFVAKFGPPDEVAAGYQTARDCSAGAVLASSRADVPIAGTPAPKKPDRGFLRNALALSVVAVVAACAAVLVLWNRGPDGPTTVPPVEPAQRPPLGELSTSWADRVVSFRFGADEPRDPQDAAPALGTADCRNPEADPPTCVTLGDGGQLVVEFVAHTIVDGPGADLAVHEVGYFEPVRVAVSENGKDWFDLGVSEQRLSTFDLAKAGLSRARFVRVTDALSMRQINGSPPGAEIDSVAALNSVAAPK